MNIDKIVANEAIPIFTYAETNEYISIE